VKEPPNGTAEARDETAVTAGQTMRDLASHLKASLSTAQLSNLMADLEMARTNRELAPVRVMVDMMQKMVDKVGAPNPGNDRLVELLIGNLAEVRAELRETRQAATPAPASTNAVSKLGEDIKAFTAAADLLGLRKTDGAGAGAAPSSLWTPDAFKTALEAAAPIVGRFADLIEARMGVTRPAAAAPTAPGRTAMGQTPQIPAEVDAAVKEQLDFFLEALRSRDFPTVRWMLENTFVDPLGAPIVQIDPDVNPIAYVLKLKPLAPKIDELRGEVKAFLDWIREGRAAEKKPA